MPAFGAGATVEGCEPNISRHHTDDRLS